DQRSFLEHSLTIDFNACIDYRNGPVKVGLIVSPQKLVISDADKNHPRCLSWPVVAAGFHNLQSWVQSDLKRTDPILVASVGREVLFKTLRVALRVKRNHLAILEHIRCSGQILVRATIVLGGDYFPFAELSIGAMITSPPGREACRLM